MSRFSIIPARALSDKKLSRTDLAVMSALGVYTDKKGWCFPSYTKLANEIEMNRRTIIRSIEKLIERGYVIKRARSREDNGYTSNEYKLLYDREEDNPLVTNLSPPSDKVVTTPSDTSCHYPSDTLDVTSILERPIELPRTTLDSGRESKNGFQDVFEFATKLIPALTPKNPGVIHQWVGKYDIELDIKPTIQRLSQSKGANNIKSFGFFTSAIADAYETRKKPLPEGRASPANTQKPEETISGAMYITLKDRRKRGEWLDSNEQRALEAYEKHQLSKVSGSTPASKPAGKKATNPKPPDTPPEPKLTEEERKMMAERLRELTAELRAK